MKLTNWEKNTLLTIFSHELEWVENNCTKAEISKYQKLYEKLKSL